jgi:hypothetical protein
MPYIDADSRQEIDAEVNALAARLRSEPIGAVNYAFSRILFQRGLNSYSSINEAIGVLECIKQELYRRIAVPYEDQKLTVNGEVFNDETV